MTRNMRWIAATLLGSAALTGAGCNTNTSPVSAGAAGLPGGNGTVAPPDIGGPLMPGSRAMPALPATAALGEAILIPNAVVNNDLRVSVAAATDGMIEVIGYPVDKADPKFNPADPDILYHPRDVKRLYPFRRLRENEIVREKQTLVRLDEQLVLVQMQAQENIILSCETAIKAAKTAEDKQLAMLEKMQTLKIGLSESEVMQQEAMYARYVENRATSEKEKAKAIGERDTARTQLSRYFIDSKMNARVVRILKNPQEFVKAGETILEIQSIDRVRVEGEVDATSASRLKKGTRVIVEPTRAVGPSDLVNYHRQEVTSVAVTAHPGRPMIVSGGLDASAIVWDVTKSQAKHRLPHAGSGVRSVAASGAGGKGHFVATGADDGRVRLWDVSNPDKLPTEPVVTFAEAHTGSVSSVAFSVDGRFLASASGRDVYLYNLAEQKRIYAIPAEHRAGVTSVRFTPQGTLVTVAQDRTIRTWNLGDKGASTLKMIDHRGGTVDVLGVSSDGSKVLFDKDASRIDLVSLADERSVGTLQNPSAGARFARLALFSADDKSILTVGSEADQRGEVTVWETPAAGGRGAERRRLLTPKKAAVTCAAFSPDPAAAERFVAVGTAEGGVYFWKQAATDDAAKEIIGEVVSVSPINSKSFQVRVEMANPLDKNGEGLQDRSLATIILPPEGVVLPAPTAPTPPPAAAPLPNVTTTPPGAQNVVPAAGTAGGGVIPAGATEVRPPLMTPPAPAPLLPVSPTTRR